MFSVIISGFVGLAFEGISSFLDNRRHKALHKAVKAVSIWTDIQRNKLMHLENTSVIYGVYNTETLERLVKTVHALHSRQTLYKSLFTGRTSAAYSQMYSKWVLQHYVINSMLHLKTIKDKYIEHIC